MRYKFIILFLLIGFVSKAQVYQLMPQYGYSTYRMNFDSTIQIPTFCGVPKLGSNKINKGALAFDSCNNRFYFFNPKSQAWDTIKSGSTIDTTKFVRYTDTSAMLLPYLRKVDTTNKWVSSVTKLNDSTIQVIKGTTTSNITIGSVTSATRLITQVWNNTGATILRGSVVYISGRHSSNLPTIALAEGNNEANSYKTFALVDGDIPDNSSGFVIQAGKILGLNLPTSSYTDGDILYLSPTVAGGYTTTKPLAPNHIVKLGSVTRAHPTQGSIEIKIENGWQLDELSDVQIASVPADSVILQFSRVDSLWHDVSPLTAIGNRYLKPTDSVSLSNRINLKLNISDTAAMLSPYMRTNTANASYVTSVFRKTASDSVFFVRGGSNNFAFRDSVGTLQIGTLTNGTAGSVVYLGTSGALRQSNTQFFFDSTQASLNLGTNTNVGSAILNLSSTTKGFLQPRLTTTQMNAISTPATGLSVFNTTDSLPYVYRGTSSGWQKNVTYTRTNDIGLLNGADQRLMIEPTTNIIAGRALTVEAGSTQAGGTSAFQPLSQTLRNWYFIKAAPNGDIYATLATTGDIYKRTGGTGNFVALAQTSRVWSGIAAQSNGDVFISVSNGFIYKQTGGTGNFTAVHSTSRLWIGMAAASNNDLYACVDNGDIYKSTDNGVTFTGLGQTSRAWRGITVAPNGDIYAVVVFGDIWKSTNGGTTFTALNATGGSKGWLDITTTSNGDIYATVIGGDIWRSTNGGTTWTALGQTQRQWGGIGAAPNGDIYATAGINATSDIFLQSAGTANLNGGTLVLQSGVGKGTGTSTINFNTGTTLASGATLQTASTKMTILGNGNVGIGTTSPSAKLELSDTARGFLQTRMTTTQRNNIASPSVGLQVFNTTDSSNYLYRGTGAGWQQLANEIVNTASLNFPSTNAQNSSDLTITLTGAVDGDAVVLGVPNAAVNANSCYTAWVSASGVVTVRFNNYSSGAIDPASATFKVTIIK